MSRRIKQILASSDTDKKISVNGWVWTRRDAGTFSFIEINDGSTLNNLQIIADESLSNYSERIKKLSTGCAIIVSGQLKESPAKGQVVELHADSGEIIGGSQREERYDVLYQRMLDANIDVQAYEWYLDLRKYGSVPHSGFGLGFERLVQYVSGMPNIREVIPFPRTPGFAPCW